MPVCTGMSDRIDHGNSYKACVQESKRASPNNHLPWCRHGYETSFEEVTRSVPRLLKSLQESQSNQTRYDFNRNNDNESHGIKFEKEVISSESTATISSEENPTKAEDKYTEKDINEKDVIVNTTRHFSSLISMNTKSNLDKKQEINNEINYEADNTLTDIKRVDRGNDKVPFKSESKIEVSSQSNFYNINQVNESDLHSRITDIIYEDVLNYTVQVSSLDTFSNDSKSPSSSILDGTVNINSSTNILSPVDEF